MFFYQKNSVPTTEQEIFNFEDVVELGNNPPQTTSNNPDQEILRNEESKEIIDINEANSNNDSTTKQRLSRLQKISGTKIIGYGVFEKSRTPKNIIATSTKKMAQEKILSVLYSARGSGDIFEKIINNSFTEQEKLVVVANIPNSQVALFASSASVVIRNLKPAFNESPETIGTFLGKIPADTIADTFIPSEIKGVFLEDGITDLSLWPNGEKLFYFSNSTQGTFGNVFSIKDNKKTIVFQSPFSEWLSQTVGASIIGLTAKPSAEAPGYSYLLDTSTENYIKTVGDIKGLTVLYAPNKQNLVFSNNNLGLNLFNTINKTVNPSGVRTLSEKCVWGKNSLVLYCAVPKDFSSQNYPDAWYQGIVSFDDIFWKIDLISQTSVVLFDPEELGGEKIDGIKLSLSPSENLLFFVNKKNGSLWSYDLD